MNNTIRCISHALGIGSIIIGLSPGLVSASECPASPVSDPPQFEWTTLTDNSGDEYYSGTLEMDEATFTINGQTLTTRAYRQENSPVASFSIPGPTITMKPGKKYVLRFKNKLPYQEASTQHNVFKDPNITNVHTHGLHISGETPSDDVTRFFEGGYGGDYVYDIPADHMGGTFWYHAHRHGSTFLQVSSGAFGMIVIDDGNDVIPANVAAMQERQFVLGFLDSDVAGTGGDTLVGGTLGPTWTINGEVSGSVCMPPNTWQHWRVLVADRDARMKTLSIGSECEVALLARDGVWRTTAPRMLTTNSIGLTGASRADIAVRCEADSSISLGNETMAQVHVDGTADSSVHPFDADGQSTRTTWSAKRPKYLRDLRGESISQSDKATIRMGARTINGSKFDINNPTLTVDNGGVQEWSLRGATNHPFHLHIYHVQIDGDCGEFEDGEFYDVVASSCTLRFDLNPVTSSVYQGRTIMHCHILEHEDQGAMGWLRVIGGEGPPVWPTDDDVTVPYDFKYQFGTGVPPGPAAPTGLGAVATSSSAIQLDWTDNASDEEGFYIERTQGSNVSNWTTGANTTQYDDTILDAATTYEYKVRAVNANGDSAFSNTASATTQSDNPGTTLEPGSVSLSTINAGKGLKHAQATVLVVDDNRNPVADATVMGEFRGDIVESINSDSTDTDGAVLINTTDDFKGKINLEFCVTSISHGTLDSYAGPEVCANL